MRSTKQRRLRVFLAHSHNDGAPVREVYSLLKLDGFSPWFDAESLLPGQDWEYEIQRSIKEADAIVLFLSQDGVNHAGYLHKELALAVDAAQRQPEGSIFLIPIRLGGCSLPERVSHLHWLEAEYSGLLIGDLYPRLQRSLLRRAAQLGLDSYSALEEINFAGKVGSYPEYYDEFEPLGKYLVNGVNPNNTKYSGIGVIGAGATSGSLRLTVEIGNRCLRYAGELEPGPLLKFSGAHSVTYSLRTDGSLEGQWGDGGREELFLASRLARLTIR